LEKPSSIILVVIIIYVVVITSFTHTTTTNNHQPPPPAMLEKLTGSLKADNPSFMLNGVEDTEYKDVSPQHAMATSREALLPHLSLSCSQPGYTLPFPPQRPIPDVGPNDVLVNVKCTGICGSDIHCESIRGSGLYSQQEQFRLNGMPALLPDTIVDTDLKHGAIGDFVVKEVSWWSALESFGRIPCFNQYSCLRPPFLRPSRCVSATNRPAR
jgi:hypothetical protein